MTTVSRAFLYPSNPVEFASVAQTSADLVIDPNIPHHFDSSDLFA